MITNAAAQTFFGKADDKLSRLVTKLVEINRSEAEGYEDMRMWGAPSECGKIIASRADRERIAVCNEFDVTLEEAYTAIQRATSERWLYFSCVVR